MDLQHVQDAMNELGKTDPLSAMLPARLRGRLSSMDEYFAFGSKETNDLMAYLKSLGVKLGTGTALDFGCGLGRATQALTGFFDQVYGVDIAPSILELANSYNHHDTRCKYILNETNDLRGFEDNSVDFIWSSGVLYLMNPTFCKKYIEEFLRILVPGGVIVFQLPAWPAKTVKGLVFRATPASLLNLYRRAKYGFEVYSIRKTEIVNFVKRTGGNILDIRDDRTVGDNWVSFQYCVSK